MYGRARLLPSRETPRAEVPREVRSSPIPTLRIPTKPIQTNPVTLRQRIRAKGKETMPNPTDRDAIKITAEDLASVTIPASPLISPVAQSSGAGGARQHPAAGLVLSGSGGIVGRAGGVGNRRARNCRRGRISLGKFPDDPTHYYADVRGVWCF